MLCLDEAVLALARLYREDVFSLPADDNFNRANRHSAYRQYVLWMYEKLGADQRKVISKLCCLENQNQLSRTNRPVCGRLAWTDLDILNIERKAYLDGLPINVPILCIYKLN